MDMNDAIAQAGQPQETFRALEALVEQTVGVKLFTLMQLDHRRGVAWRNFSNMPDAYPTSGEKPIPDNAWSQQVLDRHETFVANTIEEIAAVFPDHDLIRSLGCQSCINIPVVIAGRTIGTLNCLHDVGHYTPDRVARSEELKTPGALAFLMAAYVKDQT